ncbi:MAG: Ig-like domain-containing protein [Terracidiphilus sp.]
MNHSLEFVSGKRSCLGVCLPLFLLTLAALLLPSTAWAQVSYTGTAANQNFGSQAIGSPSAAKTLSFSVSAGTTVGSIAVVTKGAPNLDFANAAGSTCAAQDYSSATGCTVNVTFTPRFAGLREGAVVFFSETNNTGTVLGSVPIYGVGSGPQIAYGPGVATAIAPTANGEQISNPTGVAVDGAGDVFISIWDQNRVVEVPAGGGAATVIDPTANGIAIYNNHGVAVDGAGDLFIADLGNNRVVEVPAGGGAAIAIDPIVNGKGMNLPSGVAIDGAGDLFIADNSNNRVLEIPADGGAPIVIDPTVNGKTLIGPYRVAFDAAGDLFIADTGNNRVVEVPGGGGAATAIYPTVNGEGLNQPTGVAVDGAGDLFIADMVNGRVVEVPAGSGAPTAIDPTVNGASLSKPWDITFDGAGDLFIADFNNSRIVEIQRSQPAPLNFPTATDVGSTDTTDGTQTVEIQNIGNLALTLTALSYPADFSEASGDASACTGSTSLTAGQECDVPVEFTPKNAGPLSESVMLTDNALNAAPPEYAQQSISLTGTGFKLDSIVIAPSSSFATFVGGSQQFTATGSYSGGSTQNLTSLVSWNSNNTTAVTMGTFGLATAQAAGAATITASLDGVTSNAVTFTVDSAAQASIAVSSGSGQSAYETAAFANPLAAVVKDTSGDPLQGVPVTFTAPSGGAGALFSNGAATIVATTDSTGAATVTPTANATAGSYSVTATVGSLSASFSLTNLAWPVYSVTTLVDDPAGLGTNCTDPTLKVTSCSLRDAVTAANALAQTTLTPVTMALMPTINFASSLNLSAQSPGSYNITNGGTLTISANMNIVGPGANLLSLNGAGNQIININSGTLFLSGLSLVNGGTPTMNDPYGDGGNGSGGGIYNNGTLTVTNSTFTGNSATGGNASAGGPPEFGLYGGNGSGGAIYNSGTLTVANSTFSANGASGGGGYGDAGGGSGSGGGIYNGGALTVTNSTFSGNSTGGGVGGGGSDASQDIGFNGGGGSGGGIYNGGTLTVTNSTFSGNSSSGGFGGIGQGNGGDGGGGGICNGGTLTVTDSTFSGNGASGGYGGPPGNGYGGAIENGGTLTVRNSTFSGNSANGGIGPTPTPTAMSTSTI